MNNPRRLNLRFATLSIAVLLLPGVLAAQAVADPLDEAAARREFLHRLEHGTLGGASGASSLPATAPRPGWDSPPGRQLECPHGFDVLHYDLEIGFDLSAKELGGRVGLEAEMTEADLTEITLDLIDTLAVDSVLVEGIPVSFTRGDDTLGVALPYTPSVGETLDVDVFYWGSPGNEGASGFGGFWFKWNNAFSVGVGLYTLPPSMSRYWFPCFDHPCDKATVEMAFTVPWVTPRRMAVANGAFVGAIDDSLGQTTTFYWEHNYQISTYLIAVCIAEYVEMQDEYLPFIYYYVYPNLVTKAEESFNRVHIMMDAFTQRFSPYPYEKFCFMLAGIGDMEHQTCVTHVASLVDGGHGNDYILAHEMAHMWWGDGVTVGDWRDVWLSEGFATYCEAIYAGYYFGPEEYTNYMRSEIMDVYLASGHDFPIYDPDSLWSKTTYEGGACILHMLRHVVGDSAFFEGLRDYWNEYQYANATTPDFEAVMETGSGQDLDWFFQEWIYSPGWPDYEWYWSSVPLAGGEHLVSVNVAQVQDASWPVFAMPIDFLIETAGGDTTVVLWVDEDYQNFQFTVEDEPVNVVFDPGYWVLCHSAEVAASVPAEDRSLSPLVRNWSLGPVPAAGGVRSRIELTGKTGVSLSIMDIGGRLVRRMETGILDAGEHSLLWDGRDQEGRPAAPGLYFATLAAGTERREAKLVLIR